MSGSRRSLGACWFTCIPVPGSYIQLSYVCAAAKDTTYPECGEFLHVCWPAESRRRKRVAPKSRVGHALGHQRRHDTNKASVLTRMGRLKFPRPIHEAHNTAPQPQGPPVSQPATDP